MLVVTMSGCTETATLPALPCEMAVSTRRVAADRIRCCAQLRNTDHSGWAIHDAARSVDVMHLNDVVGLPFTTFVDVPAVLHDSSSARADLSELYEQYPDVAT